MRSKIFPLLKFIPRAVWDFIIIFNSSDNTGINLSAIEKIIAISFTGKIFLNGDNMLTNASVNWIIEVVNVKRDDKKTKMISRNDIFIANNTA